MFVQFMPSSLIDFVNQSSLLLVQLSYKVMAFINGAVFPCYAEVPPPSRKTFDPGLDYKCNDCLGLPTYLPTQVGWLSCRAVRIRFASHRFAPFAFAFAFAFALACRHRVITQASFPGSSQPSVVLFSPLIGGFVYTCRARLASPEWRSRITLPIDIPRYSYSGAMILVVTDYLLVQ